MMSLPANSLSYRRISGLVVAVALLLGACATNTSQSGAIAPRDFSAYLSANPDVPLINVHIPYEGHIEGTDGFVAFDEIASWNGLPDDKDAPLAIYCRSGNMSATAAETLAAMGYRNVVDLEGGMKAWSAVGYDLLADEPAPN